MKAWEIVAWVHEGSMYHPGCAVNAGLPVGTDAQERAGWTPVFATEEGIEDNTCDVCLGKILD